MKNGAIKRLRRSRSGAPCAACRRARIPRIDHLKPGACLMLLRASPLSPFARKVRMAILRLGLAERVAEVRGDPMNPQDVLRQDNPLGKIPVLITDDDHAVHDSRV